MYVDPFFAGVVATIGAEIIVLIVSAVVSAYKQKSETKAWKESQKALYEHKDK